jgi:SnoaL-like domain
MADVSDLVGKYIEAWNQTDAAARLDLIEEIWARDGRYIDPLADVAGPEQIDGVIGAVQAQFPGMQFRLAGPVDAHHDQARFTWALAPDGADAVVVGFDVARLDEDGRLALVLGFLDKVPAG